MACFRTDSFRTFASYSIFPDSLKQFLDSNMDPRVRGHKMSRYSTNCDVITSISVCSPARAWDFGFLAFSHGPEQDPRRFDVAVRTRPSHLCRVGAGTERNTEPHGHPHPRTTLLRVLSLSPRLAGIERRIHGKLPVKNELKDKLRESIVNYCIGVVFYGSETSET